MPNTASTQPRRSAKASGLRSPSAARKGLTIAALPTAVAVGFALLPIANAQSSSSSTEGITDLLGSSNLSDSFAPSNPP